MSAAFTETQNVYVYIFSSFLILNESTLLGLHSQMKYMKIEVLLLSHVPKPSVFREYSFSQQVLFLVLLTGLLPSLFCDDFI